MMYINVQTHIDNANNFIREDCNYKRRQEQSAGAAARAGYHCCEGHEVLGAPDGALRHSLDGSSNRGATQQAQSIVGEVKCLQVPRLRETAGGGGGRGARKKEAEHWRREGSRC